MPDRFPHRFQISTDGRLTIATAQTENLRDQDELDSDEPDWYVPRLGRVALDRVAVLDLETTGLNRAADFVTEIALVRLDGTPLLNLTVRLPDGVERPTPAGGEPVALDDALRALTEALADVDLLVGHNLLSFDLPFLREVATRAEVPALEMPTACDSIHLSLLVDVAIPNRQLADLVMAYGLSNDQPHRALPDATATAAVVSEMLANVDMAEPSWQLAIAALETFDHPLAKLFPSLTEPPDLAALGRPADPLLTATGSPAPDAWSATRDDFPVLHQQRGLRPRPAQQEMAHAVAGVFDGGGRLAIEAPTGTGKSLAYLLPALGRASQAGRSVLVATATKALQNQLRGDATRLHEDGLLRAPFRQLQGVGNYVCARELESVLSDSDASGFAIAVAIRALAASPSGTWDDVTDYTLRSADARYAQTRARLRTNSGGCDRRNCTWASVCPLMQQLEGLDKTPGVVSVNHALIASWIKLQQQGVAAPGDVLAQGRADLVFDEAHALEDSLTAAWTEQIDALELEILVNSLSRRSRLMRDIQRRASTDPATTEAMQALAAALPQVRSAGGELTEAIMTYLHEYAGQADAVVLQSGVVDNRPEFRTLRQTASAVRYWLIQLAKAVNALRNSLTGIKGLGSAIQRLRGYIERLDNAVDLLETLGTLPDTHFGCTGSPLRKTTPRRGPTNAYRFMSSPNSNNTSSTAPTRPCCARPPSPSSTASTTWLPAWGFASTTFRTTTLSGRCG
ncbi:exonuclease domain-containing protein [Mycolicibacterium flavescens]|uniref:exonuclease domain-containing protein n=1 Tax=Mycolicibacterium flavescens TaxID=1776 RepID=UPI001F42605E|nr:exonuclease domain-containing protein [Mycolicibacterium flavescens]